MKQLNPEHVINSLANRLTNAQVELAEKDAVIIEMSNRIKELGKDNENFKEQLKNDDGKTFKDSISNETCGKDMKATTGTIKGKGAE